MAYTTAKANITATANQIIPNVTLAKHRPAGFAAGKNKRAMALYIPVSTRAVAL